MITYNIKINPLKKRISHSDIVLTTGDTNGYKFVFAFENADAEDKIITLKAKRADGEVVTAVSQEQEIVLPANMYSIPGEVVFEIALGGEDGQYVTVQVVTAFVREGFGDDGIEGDDRYPVLTHIITEMTEYKEFIETLTDGNGNFNSAAIEDGSVEESKLSYNLQEKINTHPDWDETDKSSAGYIENKPFLGKYMEYTENEDATPVKGLMAVSGNVANAAVKVAVPNGVTITGGIPMYVWENLAFEDKVSPKTNIVESSIFTGTEILLENNTEYRLGEISGNWDFSFPQMTEDYIVSVVFATGSDVCETKFHDIIKWTGDDTDDSGLTVCANKAYTVILWYDGMYINGAVRSVER